MTVRLHGGVSTTMTACGLKHHEEIYPPTSSLTYTGLVRPTPSGRWKVKLKIKLCQKGRYVDLIKIQVHVDRATGSFRGSFAAPPPGLYELTARLYVSGVETAHSAERHFRIS